MQRHSRNFAEQHDEYRQTRRLSMKRTSYQPPDVFVPAGKTYSHGVIVEAGRTLYVAGQTARDAQGNIVCKDDAAGQTRQVLENMKRVIEGAGGRMEDV